MGLLDALAEECTHISLVAYNRTRLQAQTDKRSLTGQLESRFRYQRLLQSFKIIVREEGIRGLYKGNVPAACLYISYSATQFLCYHAIKRRLDSMVSFVVGCCSIVEAVKLMSPSQGVHRNGSTFLSGGTLLYEVAVSG